MRLNIQTAEIFVPDGLPAAEALARTTHMAIGGHQDDLEVMAFDGIVQCFQRDDRWFCGVVVTNGSGSPRAGSYRAYSDKAMQAVRRKEQKKAAIIGEYGAQILLDYSSSDVRQAGHQASVQDIKAILLAAQPQVIYTHNLHRHPGSVFHSDTRVF
jgi:LmbE family N-acetylglucosaminyl deacetylase